MDVAIDKAIKVASSNFDLGEALTARARGALAELAAKFFGRITSGSVHFSREHVDYRCSIQMQCGGIPMMTADAHHKDPYTSLNQAVGRIEAQLRRTKQVLHDDKNDHHEKGMPEVSR